MSAQNRCNWKPLEVVKYCFLGTSCHSAAMRLFSLALALSSATAAGPAFLTLHGTKDINKLLNGTHGASCSGRVVGPRHHAAVPRRRRWMRHVLRFDRLRSRAWLLCRCLTLPSQCDVHTTGSRCSAVATRRDDANVPHRARPHTPKLLHCGPRSVARRCARRPRGKH